MISNVTIGTVVYINGLRRVVSAVERRGYRSIVVRFNNTRNGCHTLHRRDFGKTWVLDPTTATSIRVERSLAWIWFIIYTYILAHLCMITLAYWDSATKRATKK